VNQAPQLPLLGRASLTVTHAGLNTVLESLAQGVPQVAIPVSYDQPGVAARIAHHGTGLVGSLDGLAAPRARGAPARGARQSFLPEERAPNPERHPAHRRALARGRTVGSGPGC
jgi:hypothetical protein